MNRAKFCCLFALCLLGISGGCDDPATPNARANGVKSVAEASSLAELLELNDRTASEYKPLNKSVHSSGGEEFIVHQASKRIDHPAIVATDRVRTHVFVFDEEGKLLKEIGPNTAATVENRVLLVPLATKDHWFIWHSEYQETKSNPQQPVPFRLTSDFYMLGNPTKLAFRVHHYGGDVTFTNEPSHLIGGLTPFLWFEGDRAQRDSGETEPVLASREKGEGTGRDGKMYQPKLEWDEQAKLYRGPARITVGEHVLYEIDLEASEAFEATDVAVEPN